ncbi:MAG: DNA repair protein [Kiritimatiellae bacterium]|nr:DNA repair protein [Kiritimatiellia bacterium]
MNDLRGSLWRKWDLHVHTPESLVHQYTGDNAWERFIQDLERLPLEFKVIGINDYLFLDGYKRLVAEKAKGRLANIDLVLPVIELRLDKFGGTAGHLSRVNFHIVFSNELSAELIEQQFLNALSSKHVLSPEYDHIRTTGKWEALPTKQSLADLGKLIIETVPEKERGKFNEPLIEGFNNLCISLGEIQKALSSHYFTGKFITAVGKTEWADIKWNDNSIADKKTIINGAGLVFISAQTTEHLVKAKKALTDAGVNNRLLDCSDAHHFSDSDQKERIGKCFTWIKADTTFAGLLQVLNEPEERVFVGDIPAIMTRVRSNTTKYIRSVRIERKTTANISETWFNNEIPLNPNLVAIIGNKGKGKSALTDTIGLLCSTKQHSHFTFLSPYNFRQAKDNKAKHFQATLTWESGTSICKGLDEAVETSHPELVKYIPQNYLETICTELGRIEESEFDRELKTVIFSHVEDTDRLGKTSLDELVAYQTTEANARIEILKQELHDINEDIVALELKTQPGYRQEIENLLAVKRQELAAHETSKPVEMKRPDNDPARQKEIGDIAGKIDIAKNRLTECDKAIEQALKEQAQQAQLITVADKLLARIANLERQVQGFITTSRAEIESIGLQCDVVVKLTINKALIDEKRTTFVEKKIGIEKHLDSSLDGSLSHNKEKIKVEIATLQEQLDGPNKKYQEHITALKTWADMRTRIEGNTTSTGTLKYYVHQLENLAQVPSMLADSKARRLTKAKEIHKVISELADAYRKLYAPVQDFITKSPLAKDRFQLNFQVGIIDTGFIETFFDIVSHGIAGSFCGVEDGLKMMRGILARHDLNTESGIEAFLSDVTDALENDKRPGGKPVIVADQIKKGKTVASLYDFLFSLEYLTPRYTLHMGDKEMDQLSPGERGTLLLAFYLLVGKDDIPLVIDQPEENLDNQTVFELLVPCIKMAKQRRQIFIVTHNPNLAVVCDAEQIICADLDKKNNYVMRYVSGAIENPVINKAIVDILEGTLPAFVNRDSKYFPTTTT